MMDMLDQLSSRVASGTSATTNRPHAVTPMGLKADNLADVLARQEREPSNSFKSTLQPIRSRGRLSFGFGGSRAEIVPASNRVSLKVVEQERQIRLMLSNHVKYKYMLLPDSMARYWWDLLMACVTILLMWRIPYSISFSESGKEYWKVFYRVTDVIYILDILANFRCVGWLVTGISPIKIKCQLTEMTSVCFLRTGYVLDTDVIMDSRKVAKRYLKGWFIIDLVGSIPIEYFVGTNTSGIERKAIKASVKYLKVPVRTSVLISSLLSSRTLVQDSLANNHITRQPFAAQKLFRIARIIKFVQ